ncbi:hypothetical protein ACH5RR_011027 [Cinchona calisaya]|uniref:Uncharacterized protein n=1 Tax=Cinchona calisaya TaxID=153742 RepID=A0ABD3A3Q1_9GENT
MSTPAATWGEDDEWELINDDGFVYRRKRRIPSATTSAPPPLDPAVVEKNRLERKKMALLKLKDKHQQEIHQWEHWSNTLNEMQQKSLILQQQKSREQNNASTSSSDEFIASPSQSSDVDCRHLVDELLSQAESQEAIIKHISNLCDLAEGLCSASEERFKKSFTELPIWGLSPQELMASLMRIIP